MQVQFGTLTAMSKCLLVSRTSCTGCLPKLVTCRAEPALFTTLALHQTGGQGISLRVRASDWGSVLRVRASDWGYGIRLRVTASNWGLRHQTEGYSIRLGVRALESGYEHQIKARASDSGTGHQTGV